MAWTTLKTWNTGDTLPASDLNTYLRDNLAFLHDRGADLASAATITPTTQFHKVTGTTTIDSIASPTDGHMVFLWFGSALTIRNNGGGTGNIRTASGGDKPVPADSFVVFRSDGTVWKEVAPGLGGGLALVADSVLGASAASFDFQNIAGGIHLRAILYGRSDAAAIAAEALFVRLNGDSGANYDWEYQRASGGGVTSSSANAATEISCFQALPAATAPASAFGIAEFVAAQYAGTTGHKAASVYAGRKSTTSIIEVTLTAGVWASTAAVTRLTLLPATGNLIAGSRASVYVL